MGVAFAIWWWYFDVARATAERPVRSHADAVRLHLWSFAHLPLYLGLVVAFVGIQLVVSVAPEPALDARQMVILIASLGVVVVSLGAISRASRAKPCALPGAVEAGLQARPGGV